MSVLIKGLDMPKEGESIIMVLEHSGKVISRLLSDGGAKAKALEDTKAILIPTPHGRLIDADKLIARLKSDNPQTSKMKWAQIVAKYVPTILEAEQ